MSAPTRSYFARSSDTVFDAAIRLASSCPSRANRAATSCGAAAASTASIRARIRGVVTSSRSSRHTRRLCSRMSPMLALPGAATTAPDARVASARVAWSGPSCAPHISIFRATSASSSDAATAAPSAATIASRTCGGCGSLLGIQRAVVPSPP